MDHNSTRFDSNATLPPAFNPADFGMIAFLQAHIHTKQLLVAFLTWVTYKMIITFDQSVELFWKRKWTLLKRCFNKSLRCRLPYGLVYCSRSLGEPSSILVPHNSSYESVMLISPNKSCKASLWVALAAAVVSVVVLDLILLIRVHALWSDSRMAVEVAVLLFLINIVMFTLVISLTYATNMVAVGMPPFTGCLIRPIFKQIWLTLIGAFVFETYTITLILVKCVPIALKPRIRSPFSSVLVTDGLIYYIIIAALHLFDIVISFYGHISLTIPVMTSYPGTALVGVACNRLLIRLQSESLIPELYLATYNDEN